MPRMLQPGWGWGGKHQASTYPATVPGMRDKNVKSQLPRKRWPKHLVKWYAELNRHNLEYAFRATNGNINNSDPNQQIPYPYDQDVIDELDLMPKFEVLTYVGNTHVVQKIGSKGIMLDTLYYDSDVNSEENYKTAPWYVSKFSAIRADGLLFNLFSPPDDNYMPLVSYDEFWIPHERAELYPPLPMYVYVTSSVGLNVRNTPSITGEKIDKLEYGYQALITEYHVEMANVWGLAGTDAWIALRYQPYRGYQNYYEPTTWHLETAPPPRPYRDLNV